MNNYNILTLLEANRTHRGGCVRLTYILGPRRSSVLLFRIHQGSIIGPISNQIPCCTAHRYKRYEFDIALLPIIIDRDFSTNGSIDCVHSSEDKRWRIKETV